MWRGEELSILSTTGAKMNAFVNFMIFYKFLYYHIS